MFFRRIFSIVVILGYSALIGQAQPQQAALEFWKRAHERYTKGDLNGALADLTRTIELGSSQRTTK